MEVKPFFEPGTINVYASTMIPKDPNLNIAKDYGAEVGDHVFTTYDANFNKRDGTTVSLTSTPEVIRGHMLHPDYKGFKRVSLVDPGMLLEGTKHQVLDGGKIIVAQTDRDIFLYRVLTLEERLLFGLDSPSVKS